MRLHSVRLYLLPHHRCPFNNSKAVIFLCQRCLQPYSSFNYFTTREGKNSTLLPTTWTSEGLSKTIPINCGVKWITRDLAKKGAHNATCKHQIDGVASVAVIRVPRMWTGVKWRNFFNRLKWKMLSIAFLPFTAEKHSSVRAQTSAPSFNMATATDACRNISWNGKTSIGVKHIFPRHFSAVATHHNERREPLLPCAPPQTNSAWCYWLLKYHPIGFPPSRFSFGGVLKRDLRRKAFVFFISAYMSIACTGTSIRENLLLVLDIGTALSYSVLLKHFQEDGIALENYSFRLWDLLHSFICVVSWKIAFKWLWMIQISTLEFGWAFATRYRLTQVCKVLKVH